jgi:ABC-2 type transport system ATP-binding protein
VKIELLDVRKSFDGVKALDGITLSVPSGGKVALVGPNGSGKSTLVRGVMGLVRCEGIRVAGVDPFAHRAALAARIAYVPQMAPLMAAPVGDLVRAVAALRSIEAGRIAQVADALGLSLEDVARRPVRALSGGMRQKLTLALALAAPASLFVMDEPTASLDERAREAFFRLFEGQAEGATLLLSSHRPDEVGRLVDRVVALEDGRLAADVPVAAAWSPAPAGPLPVRLKADATTDLQAAFSPLLSFRRVN